jgi:hypothetical protein
MPFSSRSSGSRAEQLGLGGGELVVGQRAGLVHLREPAELVCWRPGTWVATVMATLPDDRQMRR